MNNTRSNAAFFKRLKPIVYTDQSPYASEIILISLNDAGTILVNSRTDKSLRIWKCSQEALYDPITIEKAHEKAVEAVSWNPKTEYTFATVARDEYIKIWRGLTGKLDHTIKVQISNNSSPVICQKLNYSYDGKILSVVDRDSTILFYLVESNYKKIGEIKLEEYIYSLEWFHFNHSFFIVGLLDSTACIYEIKEIENNNDIDIEVVLRKKLTGHKSSITSIAIDPRGTYFGLGSNEGVLSLWSTKNFLVEKLITKVDESIRSINCSRDGTYIGVSFDGDSTIKIYDYASEEEMLDIPKSSSGKLVEPTMTWFPNKTAFVFTSDNCTTMTYMIKP